MLWLGKNHQAKRELSSIGGKAYHLFKLQDWGIEVPSFLVITTTSFHQWKNSGKLPEEFWKEIKAELQTWNTEDFAVRSSMSLEDGAEDSFAGIMESYLYVKLADIERKVYECFESCETDRAKEYLNKRNIHLQLEAAVVIQKMARSVKSGVAFSRAPVGNSSLVYIESAWGLGEGVVSGLVDVDQYYVDRFGDVLKTTIAQKESKIDYSLGTDENTKMLDVPSDLQNKATLNDKEVERLFLQVMKIEEFMGKPSDIEWCFDDAGVLNILQTRAITQKFPPLRYFVDTNLTESYPGVTSPLNADFVRKAYEEVFTGSFEILKMPQDKVKALKEHSPNLIAYFGGHLYYHIYHYYAVFHSLPGGKSTRDAWHKMIGGKIPSTMELPQYSSWTVMEKLRYYMEVIKLGIFHHSIFEKFAEDTQNNMNRLNLELNQTEDPQKIIKNFFRTLESNLGFAYTILNDYLIMINLNLLEKFINKYNLSQEDYSYLIKPQTEFDSLKPMKALKKLLNHPELTDETLSQLEIWAKESEFKNTKNPYAFLFQEMQKKGFNSLAEEILNYLTLYGNRSFEELKLESFTFKQSPHDFFNLLSWQYQTRNQEFKENKTSEHHFPWDKIGFIDKFLLKKLMNFTHRTVATRENTRLLRTEIYGWVRESLLKSFRLLKENHPDLFKNRPLKEFFSLNFADLKLYAANKLSAKDLVDIIEKKKGWLTRLPEFPEFFCHPVGYEIPSFDEYNSEIKVETLDQGGILTGLGASPGLLEAEPLVLHSPQEAIGVKNLQDRILVTKSTDPAWIFILTQCKGLISEKGSLLSHTAIIGRELNKPTVVGVKDATHLLSKAKRISLDGKLGKIEVLS
ncbi:MAG: PEP/pyruvate-binding domain-containing protein [Bacteriovoracaceae bacterium]